MATESKESGAMEVVAGEDVVIEIDEYKEAYDLLEENSSVSATDYQVLLDNPRMDDVAVKIKEKCLYKLAKIHTEGKKFDQVLSLLKSNGEFFATIPKARTAKIVRNILNIVDTIPDSLDIQVGLCQDVVEWCKIEKRTFLRQRIEAKLANLLLLKRDTTAALALINSLLKELKKLDDKQMLTETHLTEARIYHSLQNIPKAKSSLTASRTAANAIYVVPLLQAELDEASGILHCEEEDNLTAFSYFLEAFETYDQVNDKRAVMCLKYMMLCKILQGVPEEVPALMQGSKFGMKHLGPDIESMATIARAAKARSLEQFQEAVTKYSSYLKSDDLIAHHLDILYDNMLESNLLKIIYPYSCVEIEHVAKLINLPLTVVVRKLSQMILDRRFSGILDQGKGHLLIYEGTEEDLSFSKGTEIIANMGLVVESLHARAKNIQHLAKGGSIATKDGVKDTKEKKDKEATDKDKEKEKAK